MNGFTKIGPKSSMEFNPKIVDDKVYITILTQTGSVVCNGHPFVKNQSVIVNKDCCLRKSKPDEIWIDSDGIDHRL